MEIVFRGEKNHDLYLEPRSDGSVKITIRAKNGTGESVYALSSSEFDNFCEIRKNIK